MSLPTLPARAAYIHIKNSTKNNTLTLSALKDIRSQLASYMGLPDNPKPLLLPAFKRQTIDKLEADALLPTRKLISTLESPLAYLVRAPTYKRLRGHQPQVLVLRSEGPVFSAGHDVAEFQSMDDADRKQVLSVLAHIVGLIRMSPAIVVAPVQGLASAAGFQLAMCADITLAMADTKFQLPGTAELGLPDVTHLSDHGGVPKNLLFRMFTTGEAVTAADLGTGTLDVIPLPATGSGKTREEVFEERVASVVDRLATGTAGQALAFAKWAFGTQRDTRSSDESSPWAQKTTLLAAKRDNAVEGISAHVEGRTPEWPVWQPGERPKRTWETTTDGSF